MAILMKHIGKGGVESSFQGVRAPSSLSSLNTAARSNALEALLSNPIKFIPATTLTKEDEEKMAVLRNRRIVRKNETPAQAHRNATTQHVSSQWGRQREAGLRPQGMRNPGVLCYRNSSLQALMHIPKFVNWLEQDHNDLRQCHIQNCLACSLRTLCGAYWNERVDSAEIQRVLRGFWDVVGRVRLTGARWTYHGMQDADEFFQWLLIRLQEQLSAVQPGVINSIFGVELTSTVRCQRCRHVSLNAVSENTLRVSLEHDRCNRNSLAEKIRKSVFTPERPQGFRCGNARCDQVDTSTRSYMITSAPDVLIVVLKRFQWKLVGAQRKLSNRVTFSEFLDLTPYSTTAQKQSSKLLYQLSSAIHHAGGLHSGHYEAVAKGPRGVWTELEDISVSNATVRDAVSPRPGGWGWTPYILTYLRVEKWEVVKE
ncbi:MAG: hypothetical protein M1827_002122 [Pycnora praestabilis]|nr:MAG: hypothetical protein M1827_002122 [Pycnora praestabilis]